jgi:hypothetical protein
MITFDNCQEAYKTLLITVGRNHNASKDPTKHVPPTDRLSGVFAEEFFEYFKSREDSVAIEFIDYGYYIHKRLRTLTQQFDFLGYTNPDFKETYGADLSILTTDAFALNVRHSELYDLLEYMNIKLQMSNDEMYNHLIKMTLNLL